MAKYVYVCTECRKSFELEIDSGNQAPTAAECPECGSPNALKAYAAADATPKGGCAPGSGC